MVRALELIQTGTHVDHIGIGTWTSSQFEQTSIRPRTGPRVRRFFFFELELRTHKFHMEVPFHKDSQLQVPLSRNLMPTPVRSSSSSKQNHSLIGLVTYYDSHYVER